MSTRPLPPEINLVLLLSDPVLRPMDLESLREVLGELYDWHQVMGILSVHRTVGVAWRNLMDVGLETISRIKPGFIVRGLELTHTAQSLYAADQMRYTAQLMKAFDAEGIECVLLKGAAASRIGYRDIGMRYFADNDILFHRADLGRVGTVMTNFNYQQGTWDISKRVVVPATRRQILLHSVHSHETFPYVRACPEARIASHHEVDVHFSVDLLTSNNTDETVSKILSRRTRVEGVDGSPLWTPHQEDLFIFVALHFEREATHISEVDRTRDLLLYKLIDLLALLESRVLPLDLTSTVARAKEIGLDRELYFSLYYLDSVFPGRVPTEALDRLRPASSEYVHQVRDNTGPLHTWKAPLLERFFNARRQTELAETLADWTRSAN